jgi:hypothetical protein
MRRSFGRAVPHIWALSYGIVASTIVAACSFFQGTLYLDKVVNVGGKIVAQHPYIENVSSILDFAFLNPIAIYFLLSAKNGFEDAYSRFRAGRRTSLFDRVGLATVSIAVGISAMWFYFRGFLRSKFFTEAFEPTSTGVVTISITGWAIFAATAIFISLVAFMTIEFGNYILFVRHLDTRDFRFRLPPNVSDDVKAAVTPCINVAYVLATLFAILVIFIFRDFVQFEIRQSWRVWLFAPYILACLITFLPFWHLHNVMAKQRSEIIQANNSVIEEEMWAQDDATAHGQKIDPKKLIVSVDKIERLQLFYNSIPIWPTRADALLIPNISVAISLATLAYKIFDSVKASIK